MKKDILTCVVYACKSVVALNVLNDILYKIAIIIDYLSTT